ncbi:MAG: hypothetical protein AAF617_16095, partial [Bacteroidota bacterium]
ILFNLKLKENSIKEKFFEAHKDEITEDWNSIKGLLFNSHLGIRVDRIFNKEELPPIDLGYLKLTIIFCPENLTAIDKDFASDDYLPKSIQLVEKRIDYYFLKYLCNNVTFFNSLNNYSNKSISDIYQGIKQIL